MQPHPCTTPGMAVRLRRLGAGIAAMAAAVLPVNAAGSIRDALLESRPIVSLRYRYEVVDHDPFAHDALASTFRARVGIRTGEFHGFHVLLDAETLRAIGDDRYNSTQNGRLEYPVVADPEDTEINQAYLAWAGLEPVEFRLGRQRITLDNHRHIGNVGWRQLEQTFDAFSVHGDSGDRWTAFYGRVNNVNRIFGDSNPTPGLADTNLTGDFFNGSIMTPAGKVVGYAYFMENETSPAASQRSLGVRLTGDHEFPGGWSIGWTGEVADQGDYKDGSAAIDAVYYLLEGSVTLKRLKVLAAREVLGGDGTYGFFTPLATLHAFNGWADVFAGGTPADGIVDSYLSVSSEVAGIRLTGVYHEFAADNGGDDYGDEIDLQATRGFGSIYSVTLKFADYDADDFATDLRKFWVMLELSL